MRRTILAAVAAASLLAFGPPVADAVVSAGQPAPNFTKTDLTGVPRSLSDYAGKVVVIFQIGWN